MIASDIARAATHWNQVTQANRPVRANWWASDKIKQHINDKVCGAPIPGLCEGFTRLIAGCAALKPLRRGISVGCGAAQKELALLARGIVEQFVLVEISDARIAQAVDRAASLGLSPRINFIRTDDYLSITDAFDLVYWNNSLHHMPDTPRAVHWSASRISAGGVFAMDDFIGPSRFQWTDRAIQMANTFRSKLPDSIFNTELGTHPRAVVRPTVENMIKLDPSEAADSDSIIPALRSQWPDALIRYTGGAIYHTGLAHILANIPEDSPHLIAALALDDEASALGENHYAVSVIDTRAHKSHGRV